MAFPRRTHDCGSFRAEHAGTEVVLNGWAHRIRDLGGLFFLDLRDRTGLVQCFFDPATLPNASEIRPEMCLAIRGVIEMRAEQNRNPKMPTGDVDVRVTS